MEAPTDAAAGHRSEVLPWWHRSRGAAMTSLGEVLKDYCIDIRRVEVHEYGPGCASGFDNTVVCDMISAYFLTKSQISKVGVVSFPRDVTHQSWVQC